MAVSDAYGTLEPGYGKLVLVHAGKGTSAGTGCNYGDVMFRDTDWVWKKGTAAAATGVFGFNQNNTLLTHSFNYLTGATTSTRGSADADPTTSIAVRGRITTQADGVINPFQLVMPSANHPTNHVQAWNGTNGNAVIGVYVENVTTVKNANEALAACADDDYIKIDFPFGGKEVAT